MSSSTLLPIDIEDDIILRLPALSLLKFRCVCKRWCELISNEKVRLVLVCGNKMYSSVNHYDSSSPLTCYDQTVEIDYPFKSPEFQSLCQSLHPRLAFIYNEVYVRGSCNGLICIETPRLVKNDRCCFAFKGEIISLMNPYTKEYKEIPNPTYPNDFEGFYNDLDPSFNVHSSFADKAFGFGYDSKIEDYKVVRIYIPGTHISEDNREKIRFGCGVMVYTLGSDSWKRIPSIFPYVMGSEDGVLVNGGLHWTATQWSRGIRTSNNDVIVSFDLEQETFVDVSPLENLDHELSTTVGNLGGCLCIFGKRYPRFVDVWVMKDYGVRESWTKFFTINWNLLGGCFSFRLAPIQYFKNGQFLLSIQSPIIDDIKYEHSLVLYDPTRETIRRLKIHSGQDWGVSQTYVESLVSLNTGTYLRQRILGENKKNKKKKATLTSGSRFSCLSLQDSSDDESK